MKKKLYRSRTERMVWGVCGGLAEYFEIDPTIIRIIFVLLVLANGFGLLAYLILAIVVPLEGSKAASPKETLKENMDELKQRAGEMGEEVHSALAGEGNTEEGLKARNRQRNILGITIVVIGLIFLLGTLNLNFFWWLKWSYLWPLALVAVGLIFILSARNK